MEKVEKRLTDLSGALAHNCPEIKLKEQSRARQMQHADVTKPNANKKVGIR
ncbi:hypothetical protein HLB25_14840 [Dickeya dadantii]|uniref:hypothetical protein n=1 Tax=Dickeya dadantii TaxID=204038 RepID=UPI0014955B9A|nr:hypothetical protein [Dickeya dadantii]NPE55466.1 hypothetical protein [Dickeya dadantii]NPE58410.1 hypothetical protein [Dickeya dadantii]NPE63324.1 hypothetical protein [Dickeya dadantii]NPE67917.1 hypothetical protein [Dickeya dadantii]NPE69422.1 hypothetical protein [Dickeya dadantii]